MESDLIFVYGTLRRGASQHFRLNDAVFFGAAKLGGRMYRRDWYPAAVADATGPMVTGELYLIASTLLGGLDEYEGDEFKRRRQVVLVHKGAPVVAWVWLWAAPVEGMETIPGGDWLAVSPDRD